jgi:hypothetical protein
MSWMTKEGSSSALGQSPLRFPLNELERSGVALTTHEATTAACCDCLADGRYGQQSGATTKGADPCWTGKAVGKSPDEGGVHPSEGFG